MRNWLRQKWLWLKEKFFTRRMILPVIIGELIFWSPFIVTVPLAIVYPMMWTVVGAIYTVQVWLLPAIPIQIALILFIAKIFKRL
jgi:hypothetical protein